MAKYRVSVLSIAHETFYVEADNESEATEQAFEEAGRDSEDGPEVKLESIVIATDYEWKKYA